MDEIIKAYQVVVCSCDGGRIGETYGQHFFIKKAKAEAKMLKLVNDHNEKEQQRGKYYRGPGQLYKQDSVDGVSGWCCWQYGSMIYLKEIKIDAS